MVAVGSKSMPDKQGLDLNLSKNSKDNQENELFSEIFSSKSLPCSNLNSLKLELQRDYMGSGLDLCLQDLEPISSLLNAGLLNPESIFSENHPICLAGRNFFLKQFDTAYCILDDYIPRRNEKIIFNTLLMVICLKKGNTEKAIFFAKKLFLTDESQPHRFLNFLELVVALGQYYFAEYWIKRFKANFSNNVFFLKNAVITYLNLGLIGKAVKLRDDYINGLIIEQGVQTKERDLLIRLKNMVSHSSIEKYNYSWYQNGSNILFSSDDRKTVPVFTLPKSGTHFLRNIAKHVPEVDWKIAHVYQHKAIHFMKNKLVVTIRDPRATILSLKNYVDKRVQEYDEKGFVNSPAFNFIHFDKWSQMNDEEKFNQIIDCSEEGSAIYTEFYHRAFFETSLMLYNDLAHICRFEDLCATKNGKISEKQIITLSELFDFFEIDIPKDRISKMLHESWGNSETFHSADPNAWKNDLSKNIIAKIEKKYGHFIEHWGYQ